MKELKTVLMLSRFFPPGFEIGGKRAYRFARYLPEFGWRAAIITDVAPSGARADATAGRPLPDVHSVHRVWYPPDWPRPEATSSDGTVKAPTKALPGKPDALLERAAWHLAMPLGRELKLVPRAVQLIRRLAKTERADAIFATSSPYSALVHGAAAKAVTGLPLHLDLRDPWSMNFLQRTKSPWTRWSESRVESAVLHRADRITMTCDAAAVAYRERYPELAPRIGRIFNSFDPAQRPASIAKDKTSRKPRHGPTTVVHFGNCYGIRRLDTVIKALALLRDKDGLTPADIQLHNLGRMAVSDIDLLEALDMQPYVQARPVVPYEEGLERLVAADLQLLLAYGSERLFVPAKLYDYLLTEAPIFCVAPASELTEIVARTGTGMSVEPGAIVAAADVMRRAHAARSSGQRLVTRREEPIQAFSARTTAKELAQSLDDMLVQHKS